VIVLLVSAVLITPLLSIVIFILAALLSGRSQTPATKAFADGIVVIVVLTVVCWVVGWMLGGPEVRNRKVLAISTAMRNCGICVPLLSTTFPALKCSRRFWRLAVSRFR
jgi:hypothetical protein